jgi:hypothetical protein
MSCSCESPCSADAGREAFALPAPFISDTATLPPESPAIHKPSVDFYHLAGISVRFFALALI